MLILRTSKISLILILTAILLFTISETAHCFCGMKYSFTYKKDVTALKRLGQISCLNLNCTRQKAERFITVYNRYTTSPFHSYWAGFQELPTIVKKASYLIRSQLIVSWFMSSGFQQTGKQPNSFQKWPAWK